LIKVKENKLKKNEEDTYTDNNSSNSSFQSGFRNFSSIKDFNNSSNLRFTRKYNQLDDLTQLLNSSHNYKRALKLTESSNYRDETFPANLESLVGYQQFEPSHFVFDLCWLRPKQFYTLFTKQNTLFVKPETSENFIVYDKIQAADMKQGRLGDCYLLAACGAIAQFPHRLERIFISGKNYNPNGLYAVAVCINGIWEEILLDDFFPCVRSSQTPVFSTSKNNSLWMMLLEKAWAKVHFGFFNIARGFVAETLRDFTGAPTETYFIKDQDLSSQRQLNERNAKNWKLLMKAFQLKYIICTSSKSNKDKTDSIDKTLGISWNHAYSILGVYELGEDPDYRILKLRNPWGTGGWTKSWNSKDPRWTPELKNKLKYSEIGNGIFFIPYSAVIKYFSCFQICYYHDNYKYSSLKVQTVPDQNIVILSVRISKKGLFYFSLNQINKRFYPFDKSYEYSEMNFILYKCNEHNHITYLSANLKNKKESWIEYETQPGKYLLEIRPNYKSFVKEFVVSVYGPSTSQIKIEDSSNFNKTHPNQFLIEAMEKQILNTGLKFKTPFQTKNFSYSLADLRNGIGFIYFQNDELEYEINVSVNMSKSKNIEIIYPGKCLEISLHLGSMQSKIIIFIANKLPYSFSTHFSFSCKKENKKILKNSVQKDKFEKAPQPQIDIFKPVSPEKNLIRKKSQENLSEMIKFKKYNIFLFKNKSDDSVFLVYENKSQRSYNVYVVFDLVNASIDGQLENKITFFLMKGECFFINIVRDNDRKKMKCKILEQDIWDIL
jgi:calpain-15